MKRRALLQATMSGILAKPVSRLLQPVTLSRLFSPQILAGSSLYSFNNSAHALASDSAASIAKSATGSPRRYSQPSPSATLRLPADHGPHPDFRTEWWYFTGWFESENTGQPLGLQLTFFRSAPDVDLRNPSQFNPTQLILAHAAIADPTLGKLRHIETAGRHDELDSLMAGSRLGNSNAPLDLKLGNWLLQCMPNGLWICQIETKDLAFNLTIGPQGSIWLQGQTGYSQKGPLPEQSSHYITLPDLAAEGTIRVNTETFKIKGQFWMDHEWSSTLLADDAQGWDWVGLNGQDGSALMAFQIRSKSGNKPPIWTHGAIRTPNGQVRTFQRVKFETIQQWTSIRTGVKYPVHQRLHLDETILDLVPLFNDQELDSRQSTGTIYWEGAVTVKEPSDTHWGRGYLEMTGYDRPMRL